MDTKRGQLYLGGSLDASGGVTEPLSYEAADLTTHGVIVGMTGSGKTGLAVDLLEEALLSGIPALIIDPKGDMTNLLLNFPQLRPEDFRPWVDEAAARRLSVSADELAAQTAGEWKQGLAQWGIDSVRMQRLKDSTELTVYTPGSGAGVPLDVLGSLAAPPGRDVEATRDEIEGFVSSLLVLAGIKSDPISGPEHILLATIIEDAWSRSQNLDLASLIGEIQQPRFRKLGVFELDAFIPPGDRTGLAMRLNGLMASPSFAAWRQGQPLDVGQLLMGPEDSAGRTRGAIFYLAHLSEPERQFIVTLLLSKLVTYMRNQPGSSDLRVLIYMDEVAGFAPPTAEPPSKKPILTLAKQARAFGFGMLLTTQNPMDFDYKVMSNAGTWLIGRLQTERDKARILEGMQAVTGDVDLATLDETISGLGKRQFMLHTARGRPPRVFTTRWAMSYLAGPLTKDQIGLLPGTRPQPQPAMSVPATAPAPTPLPDMSADVVPVAPAVAAGIPVTFLDPAASWSGVIQADGSSNQLRAMVAATVNLVYDDAPAGVDHREVFEAVLSDPGNQLTTQTVVPVDHDPRDFLARPPAGATFVLSPAALDKPSFWKKLTTDLTDYLVASRRVEVWKNPGLKLYSRVGELESDFRARCISVAGEECDRAIAALGDRYRTRIERVRDQIATARRRVADLEADLAARKQEEVLSGAGDLLGAILGGRRRDTISRAASRRSQTRRTEARRDTALDAVSDRQTDLSDLEADLADEVNALTAEWDEKAAVIERIEVPLEKVDVKVTELKLVWVPGA
ncbi:MAG TPA: DUF87 domain-containing protein [Acidimicrobiia bacterium]|nr:DUF87 domain-containing protein [Acidimicrobiia bacterium]